MYEAGIELETSRRQITDKDSEGKNWDRTLPLSRRLEIGWDTAIDVILNQQWLVVLSASLV